MIKIDKEVLDFIESEYLNTEYVQQTTCKYRRIDVSGRRFYLRITDEGEITLAPSVTSIIGSQMPVNQYFVDWKIKHGETMATWLSDQSAAYGTFLHTIYNRILQGEKISRNEEIILIELQSFCRDNNYDYNEVYKWYTTQHRINNGKKRNLPKEIFSFIKFIQDYNVRPIAIEYIIMSNDGQEEKFFCKNHCEYVSVEMIAKCKIAGGQDKCYKCNHLIKMETCASAIDLICYMTIDDKETIAIVDYKSGMKGFYESHYVQGESYLMIWNKENPGLKAEIFFNFSPEVFKYPTRSNTKFYNLENQNKNMIGKFNLYAKLFHIDKENFKIKKRYEMVDGEFGIDTDLESIFIEIDDIEITREKIMMELSDGKQNNK